MANFLKDNSDLLFYLDRGVDWSSIAELTEAGFREPGGFESLAEAREFYRDTLEMIGQFSADEVAPIAAALDRQGVEFVDGEVVFPAEHVAIFKQIKDLELYGMCLPRAVDGLNCPMLVYFMVVEIMSRADVSVTSHYGFHGGIAAAMLLFSITEGTTEFGSEPWQINKTRFAEEIADIVSGKAWGCMDITEPDAGSDMAALRSRGELDEDGNWFVTGQKIFITSGHGKYHFVIAKTEDGTGGDLGLEGLSMFLVKAYDEDDAGNKTWHATVERVEEKLGHHGSVTAAISFDRTPAKLIGKRGEGFRYMLVLMNNARVGVGFEGIGLCEAAYRAARDYAAERPSMGKTIDRHEMIADYLDEMEIDLIAMRAIAMMACYHEEMAQKLKLRAAAISESSVDAERDQRQAKRHKARSRRVTPLLKYIVAEKAVEMSRRCLQIHGGNGYMKEYPAERLLRDSLVLPVYEGTSQIQSLMAMKDSLSALMKDPQAFVRRLAQTRWRALSARDPLERRVAKIQLLSLSAQQHLMTKTATDKFRSLVGVPLAKWPKRFLKDWDPKRDFSYAMLHAERLTKLLTDEIICETLLDQAVRFPERREILERYLERAEPRCRFWHEQLTTTGQRLLAKLAGLTNGSTSHEQAAG